MLNKGKPIVMKTEFLSETLLMKSLVEDFVIKGARREQRQVDKWVEIRIV